jgi:hypothetical protein
MARSSPGPAALLDWRGFLTTYFPARQRHDFEALIAYGAYKRSRGVDKPSTAPGVSAAGNGTGETAALEAWEDEGGPAT